METQYLKQQIATNEEFWTTFWKSLNSPLSYWRDYSNYSKRKWIELCKKDSLMKSYLKIIFDNSPLFKGEYPIVFANETGMILTNYRLFINFQDGLFIIPLANIKFYGIKTIKGSWLDGNIEEFKITFTASGEEQNIYPEYFIKEEFIKSALGKKEWKNLNPEVWKYLAYSFFEFENNLNIYPKKIDFNPQLDQNEIEKNIITPQNRRKPNKREKNKTQSKNISYKGANLLLSLLIIVGLIYTVLKFNNSPSFGWGWFIAAVIACTIGIGFIFRFLLNILERVFTENFYIKTGRVVVGIAICSILILSSNFSVSISNQNTSSSSSASYYEPQYCKKHERMYNPNNAWGGCPECIEEEERENLKEAIDN